MSPSAEQMLNDLLNLPAGDRLQIAEALYSSLQPSDKPPFDSSWIETIKRRSAEIDSGQVTAIPWEEVKRRLRDRVGG